MTIMNPRTFLAISFFLITASILAPIKDRGTARLSWEGVIPRMLSGDLLPAESCVVLVDSRGSGEVTALSADAQSLVNEQAAGVIELRCGEEVTLTAEPASRWRFDHWIGLSDAERHKSTIVIAAPDNITAVFVPRAVTNQVVDRPYYNRDGELVSTIEILEPIWRTFTSNSPASANAEAPNIDVWYGDVQSFGEIGTPQQWLNILGNVSDVDGDLSSLSYTLNGGEPRELAYGGSGTQNDTRRLWMPGDFNIDIDKDDPNLLLAPATNEIVITAADSLGMTDAYTETLSYDPNNTWPIPYFVDWSSASSIQDEAQVVDGKWEIHDFDNAGGIDGVHPVETGYDRIIAIGEGSYDDPGWTEFEATVPVIVHGINEDGFSKGQRAPAIGVVMRWGGHTADTPSPCDEQPLCGYLPIGAASWYEWDKADDTRTQADFSIWLQGPGLQVKDPNGLLLEYDKLYYWKVRVDNSVGTKGLYHLRMWADGDQQPDTWHTVEGNSLSLRDGSLLLLAHHVDVTFGDVKICPLDGCSEETIPPVISDVSVVAGINEAAVSWKSDEPATSRVDYWTDPASKQTVSSNDLVTDHLLQLQNLSADTTYAFQVISKDVDGNESAESGSFTTDPEPPKTYELVILIDGSGTVSVDPETPGLVYNPGDQVTLTPIPGHSKSYFAGWTLDVTGDDDPLVLVITDDTTVQANFAQYQVGDFMNHLPLALNR